MTDGYDADESTKPCAWHDVMLLDEYDFFPRTWGLMRIVHWTDCSWTPLLAFLISFFGRCIHGTVMRYERALDFPCLRIYLFVSAPGRLQVWMSNGARHGICPAQK